MYTRNVYFKVWVGNMSGSSVSAEDDLYQRESVYRFYSSPHVWFLNEAKPGNRNLTLMCTLVYFTDSSTDIYWTIATIKVHVQQHNNNNLACIWSFADFCSFCEVCEEDAISNCFFSDNIFTIYSSVYNSMWRCLNYHFKSHRSTTIEI